MYSYCYIYVFLLSSVYYVLCSVYSVFIVATDILRLSWLRVFHAFSLEIRQMHGKYSKDRTRFSFFLIGELCFSMYCFASIMCYSMNLFVCKYVLLPLRVNPIADTYIISYNFSFCRRIVCGETDECQQFYWHVFSF
jgi:hypothetical protein